METVLFFDTETTGKPKDYKASFANVDNWPRVVQLGFALCKNGEVLSAENIIIKPNGWVIEPEAEKVHGISMAMAEMEGVDIGDALDKFSQAIEAPSLLVAHNLKFDFNVLAAEYVRAGMKAAVKPKLCTMLLATPIVKIPSPYGGWKWPKLQELHTFLFGEGFEGGHDALTDVLAMAKCYFELEKRGLLVTHAHA